MSNKKDIFGIGTQVVLKDTGETGEITKLPSNPDSQFTVLLTTQERVRSLVGNMEVAEQKCNLHKPTPDEFLSHLKDNSPEGYQKIINKYKELKNSKYTTGPFQTKAFQDINEWLSGEIKPLFYSETQAIQNGGEIREGITQNGKTVRYSEMTLNSNFSDGKFLGYGVCNTSKEDEIRNIKRTLKDFER